MELIYTTLILSALFGVGGTWIRIIIQLNRDGVLPGGESWEFGLLTETFIGVMMGIVSWLVYLTTETPPESVVVPMLYLAAIALGLAGTDVLENLLKKWIPVG